MTHLEFSLGIQVMLKCLFVTGSVHNITFLEFLIINLHSQMYALAKFQHRVPKSFGVIALQSSNNRKIDLYNKYRENKLQVLQNPFVTYNAMMYREAICTIVFTMNRKI